MSEQDFHVEETKEQLERKLALRSEETDLVSRNILWGSSETNTDYSEAKKKITKQKSVEQLAKKLTTRREREDLVERHIIEDPRIAPHLVETARELKFNSTVANVDRGLKFRPEKSRLVDTNIIKETPESQQALCKSHSVDRVHKQLRQRARPRELEDRNILPDHRIAAGLQDTCKQLESSRVSTRLTQHISARPNPQDLVEKHIMTDEEAAEIHSE